jgi:hypothetical protein
MLEWLVAIAAFVLVLALLPPVLRRARASRRKVGGGSGVMIGIGLVFAMIFDPKAAQAIELIEKKQDECEDSESGDEP